MGYDLIVSDESHRQRLAHVELDPDEQFAIETLARTRGLPVLGSFPQYWGDERHVAVTELRQLLDEIAQLERLPSLTPEVLSAATKLREIVDVALRNGRPLGVIPD